MMCPEAEGYIILTSPESVLFSCYHGNQVLLGVSGLQNVVSMVMVYTTTYLLSGDSIVCNNINYQLHKLHDYVTLYLPDTYYKASSK